MKKILLKLLMCLFSLVVYMNGFMKIPPALDHISIDKTLKTIPENWNAPVVSKTVIMVIDGLRNDHMSGMNIMDYSTNLVKNKQGIMYHVRTETPTVTLPRIKSLLTGSIPGFMDVIFNFASYKFTDSNLIQLWKQKQYKINFFGDDTWTTLFPSSFDVSVGVESFFVSDYDQVDHSVTAQLNDTLPENSWDVLILHYLGLDHIGHLEGPQSQLIEPKLKEMDGIIQKIHHELEQKNQPYAFFVCGDHGMSDGGGHGGASESEIMTSGLLTSSIFKEYDVPDKIQHIHQVDIASTLAALTGVDVPDSNVGYPMSHVMEALPLKKRIAAEEMVTRQLVDNAISHLDDVEKEDIHVLRNKMTGQLESLVEKCAINCSRDAAQPVLSSFHQFRMKIGHVLKNSVHSYDMVSIMGSVAIIFLVSSSLLVSGLNRKMEVTEVTIIDWILMMISVIAFFVNGYSWIFLLGLSALGVLDLVRTFFKLQPNTNIRMNRPHLLDKFITVCIVAYPLSLVSTSFVEEEHQTLYFIVATIHLLLIVCFCKQFLSDSKLDELWKSDVKELIVERILCYFKLATPRAAKFLSMLISVILSWVIFGFIRHFNATGDKWKHIPDWNDKILAVDTSFVIFINAICLCCVLVLYNISALSKMIMFPFAMTMARQMADVGMVGDPSFKVLTNLGVYFIIAGGFLAVIGELLKKRNTLSKRSTKVSVSHYFYCSLELLLVSFFVSLQMYENVILTSLSILQMSVFVSVLVRAAPHLKIPASNVSCIIFWLANSHFFIHGNSNSLTTVKLNVGFRGIPFYMPFLHGLLIAVHTFGPRLIVFTHFLRIQMTIRKNRHGVENTIRDWLRLQLLVLCVYLCVVAIQRYHLFVWTVFAPKLLYECCHLIVMFMVTLTFYLIDSYVRRYVKGSILP